jgi:hypothetical protein
VANATPKRTRCASIAFWTLRKKSMSLRHSERPLRAGSLFRARNGATALAWAPVLPEATVVGALSALLRP